MKGYIQLVEFIRFPDICTQLASESCGTLPIGRVRAGAAAEWQGNLQEEAEDRLQLRVPVLCRLFRGHKGAEAVVHRLAAKVPLCLVRLVRQQTEAVLRPL